MVYLKGKRYKTVNRNLGLGRAFAKNTTHIMKKELCQKTGGSTMSKGRTIYWIIGIVAVTAIGFLVIPPLMKKCSNKLYKSSLKKDKINFENMGPEVLKKEESKEE